MSGNGENLAKGSEKVDEEKLVWGPRGRKYGLYLFAIALAGWALASYNYNLLTVEFPIVADALNLTPVQVGEIGTIISLASIFVPILVGYWMDAYGRRLMWMVALGISAAFTGLTAIVTNFWELALFRALASSFGLAELGVSITIVNESLGPKQRGWLYSWVQAGWPLGVFIASGTFLAFNRFGWQVVFAIGAIPLILVMIGRLWIKEPDRYLNLKKIRELLKQGKKKEEIAGFAEYAVDLDEAKKVTFVQIFRTPGYVRTQLIKVMVTWFFYASSWMLTNVFISEYLVHFYGWSANYVATLLLVSSGIGYFFYPLGGYFGERIGRKAVLVYTAAATPILAALFLILIKNVLAASIVYFFIYQATNGTWSGVGYAYWGESFPTRVRGTVMGFLTGWFNFSTFVGGLIYTALVAFFQSEPAYIWLIMAVGLACGELFAITLRNIKPGSTLEEISI